MSIVLAQNPFNPLLAKDEVGRAKRTSNLLPAADHAYGKPNAIDTENAKRITSSWLEHVPSKKRVDSSSVDFIRLNGSASAIPKVSPKVIQALAAKIKERQIKAQQQPSPVEREFEKLPVGAPCMPNRKPLDSQRASFMDIIQNKFGNEGESTCLARYKDYYEQKQAASRVKTTIKQTKASRGRNSVVEAAFSALTTPSSPFKLTKFKNVASRYQNT